MKRFTTFLKCGLSISYILLFLNACEKKPNSLPDDNEVYTVAIKFQEFKSAIHPLEKWAGLPTASPTKLHAGFTGQQAASYLYYWSFNQHSQLPDIRANTGAVISYNDGQQPSNYTAKGWASNGYPAGQAMSITGLESLLIVLPLNAVSALESFGFDIGSSATGPKDFSIWYGQDGLTYQLLAEDNQFSNTGGSYPKNTFRYYLDALTLDMNAPLYIKLTPKAGLREEGSNYNPRQGVCRFDNIYLTGQVRSAYLPSIRQFDYRIFEQETGGLVLSGSISLESAHMPKLDLELPKGQYKAVFVYNASDALLSMPYALHASDFYIANLFSNYQAQVFALQSDFDVQGDMELDLLLGRLYSQVRFEFSDTHRLSSIARIELKPLHIPFIYAPFNGTVSNPVTDKSGIQFMNFQDAPNTLVFNQFMGILPSAKPVAYALEVFDQQGSLVRSFTVESLMRNNVQLVFRGALLAGEDVATNFSIRLNEAWDGTHEIAF